MWTRLWPPWMCGCGEWQIDATIGKESLDHVSELLYEAIAHHLATECSFRDAVREGTPP